MKRENLTNDEAAKYLRISKPSLWRLRATGKLAYYRVGGKLIFDRADLDKYLDSCRRGEKK